MTLIKVFQASYLKVRIYDSRQTLGKEAAYEAGFTIKRLLRRQEEINIIFAAAPSQDNFLEEFAKIDSIPWKKINAFHMDEYLSLEAGAPQSFNSYLNKKIFGKVAFKSVNYIDGNAADVQGECRRYSDLLIKFPPDIIIMGIGENGHIAFNDPEAAAENLSILIENAEPWKPKIYLPNGKELMLLIPSFLLPELWR